MEIDLTAGLPRNEPVRKDRQTNLSYTEEYRDNLFYLWYNAGKPRGRTLIQMIPPDMTGRVPTYVVLMRWMREEGWYEKARALDEEVVHRVQEIAIQRKVEMFERHAETGRILLERGLEHVLKENSEIGSMTEAIKLIKLGAELERASTGGAQAITDISKMTDSSLISTISKLLGNMDESELEELESETVLVSTEENPVEGEVRELD